MKISKARQKEVEKNMALGIRGVLHIEWNNLYRAAFQIGKKRTFKASRDFNEAVAWLWDQWKTHKEPLGYFIKDRRPELHEYVTKHPRVFSGLKG